MIIFRLIGESFRFAFDALRQNKLRTMLSLLGITIGIFTIITVFTAVDTLRDKLQSSVDKLGSNTVFVHKWPWIFSDSFPWWKYINRPSPTTRDHKDLKDRLEFARGVSFQVNRSGRTIKYLNKSIDGASVSAVSQEYNLVWNLEFGEGRYFSDLEGKSGSPVCIIGAEIAKGLFGDDDAVGKQIQVLGRRTTIVGVFEREGQDMMGMSKDEVIIIPLNYAKSLFDVNDENYSPQIIVRGKDGIPFSDVESELKGAMRSIRRLQPGVEDDFSLNKTTMISNQLDTVFSMVNVAGWVIGGFSILVGGFGIANIMFVSVKERTNIIGIQKSLGAKNYFILLQFMFEAIVLCILGGLLGLMFVYITTVFFTYVVDVEIILYFKNIVLGIGISVIIGSISGFWPAYSASKLDAVEAIRS